MSHYSCDNGFQIVASCLVCGRVASRVFPGCDSHTLGSLVRTEDLWLKGYSQEQLVRYHRPYRIGRKVCSPTRRLVNFAVHTARLWVNNTAPEYESYRATRIHGVSAGFPTLTCSYRFSQCGFVAAWHPHHSTSRH